MEKLGSEFYPIGFDINNSPFENITIDNAIYKYGYKPFNLGKFCDGWIYTKPFSEYEHVTYIEDFINETNIVTAQQQAPNPFYRTKSIDYFNEGAQSELENRIERIHKLED